MNNLCQSWFAIDYKWCTCDTRFSPLMGPCDKYGNCGSANMDMSTSTWIYHAQQTKTGRVKYTNSNKECALRTGLSGNNTNKDLFKFRDKYWARERRESISVKHKAVRAFSPGASRNARVPSWVTYRLNLWRGKWAGAKGGWNASDFRFRDGCLLRFNPESWESQDGSKKS